MFDVERAARLCNSVSIVSTKMNVSPADFGRLSVEHASGPKAIRSELLQDGPCNDLVFDPHVCLQRGFQFLVRAVWADRA
jgi:hypothetical protein